MEGGLLTPLYQRVLSTPDATPIKPADGWREYFQQCPHGKDISNSVDTHGKGISKSSACCWRIALPTLSWCVYVVLSIPTAMPIKPADWWREYFQQCPHGKDVSDSACLGGLSPHSGVCIRVLFIPNATPSKESVSRDFVFFMNQTHI